LNANLSLSRDKGQYYRGQKYGLFDG